MVDYQLRDFWTLARGIRRGNLGLLSTMKALASKNNRSGQRAALFVNSHQSKEATK